MAQTQSAEERARLKKQWTDLAIKQAGTSQWEEAVVTNKNILQLFPSEPEAYNRLGKAYSELGQYTEARDAYSQTLIYNPKNTIAKKNLDRLALLQESSIEIHLGSGVLILSFSLKRRGKPELPIYSRELRPARWHASQWVIRCSCTRLDTQFSRAIVRTKISGKLSHAWRTA